MNAVPVINENDVVAVNELKYIESFGDNDNLSALVAGLIDADMLMILSDVNGLYTGDPSSNPDAELIHEVSELSNDILALAGDPSSGVGTGGMRSKLMAAEKALNAGCGVCILNGMDPENILRFFEGKMVGTYFSNAAKPSDRKKLWLSYATIPKGTIVIDDGAVKALTETHSSLLSMGVTCVSGDFHAAEIIKIVDKNGIGIALGKCRFSSKELNLIKQKPSTLIHEILGRNCSSIVVHCDDMGFV